MATQDHNTQGKRKIRRGWLAATVSLGAVGLLAALLAQTASPWTDDKLKPGQGRLRAVYIKELRDDINEKRTLSPDARCKAGSGFFVFEDEPLLAEKPIRAKHINQLSQAIGQVYDAFPLLPRPPLPAVNAGGVVRATHILQLRNAIAGIAPSCPGCTCTIWADDACGPAGGCDLGKMHKVRTCTPGNCQDQDKCVPDPACPLTCPQPCEGRFGVCGDPNCSPGWQRYAEYCPDPADRCTMKFTGNYSCGIAGGCGVCGGAGAGCSSDPDCCAGLWCNGGACDFN